MNPPRAQFRERTRLHGGDEVAIHDCDRRIRGRLSDVCERRSPRGPVVRRLAGRVRPWRAGVDIRDGSADSGLPGTDRLRASRSGLLKDGGEAQLFHGAGVRLIIQRRSVPLGFILHEGDTLADHGVAEHDDRGRLVHPRFPGCRVDLGEVMSVHLDDAPTVRSPVRWNVHPHHFVRVPGYLHAIHVHERRDVRQPMMDSHASGLRHLALVLPAVAHQAVRVPAQTADPRRESHPDRSGEALPQVPRVPLDTGNAPLDMALERALRLTEMRDRVFQVEEPSVSQSAVDAGRCMTVVHNDAVPLGPVGPFGIQPSEVVDDHEHLERGHGAARMTGARHRSHRQDRAPQLARPLLKLGKFCLRQCLRDESPLRHDGSVRWPCSGSIR